MASIWPPENEWAGSSLDALEADVFAALFSDARATFDELPPGSTELRGWWGDTFAEVPGDTWGSKLWLAERAKLTNDPNVPGVSLERLKKWTEQALQYMIDAGVIPSLEIVKARVDGEARLGLSLIRQRGDSPITFFFDQLWAEKFSG